MEEHLPAFLNDILKKEYGEHYFKQILEGYRQRRNTTFRINTLKSSINKVKNELDNNSIKYNICSWNENAIILNEEMEHTIRQLDIYLNGEIYLQSLSSIIPPFILQARPKENILDMCAAPGGKTTQMSALSDNQALITACERNTIRADRLRYNINMQGCRGITIINKDARDLDDFLKFDKILLDAPCSGSGTIYLKDDKLEKYFKQDLLDKSIKTQKALIKKAIKLLKPGGELVYSTCSILKEENEEIIKIVLDNNDVSLVPIDLDDSIPLLPTSIIGTACVMPCKEYEGFFIAKLKKIS